MGCTLASARELEHEVRRLIYLCPDGEAITPLLLPERIARTALPSHMEEGLDLNLEHQLAAMERQMIRRALELSKWNRTQAARMLGVTRPGLTMKMVRLGIEKSGSTPES